MRLVQIEAQTNEDVDRLLRELSAYSPRRSHRLLVIQLGADSHSELMPLLAAVETCLSANDIRSVRIEIDGNTYMMTPSR